MFMRDNSENSFQSLRPNINNDTIRMNNIGLINWNNLVADYRTQ